MTDDFWENTVQSIYDKFLRHNYAFHREVYQLLHRVLHDEVAEPFRFLDIACGDARATVTALRGTAVSHYFGIDFSRRMLDGAESNLSVLDCPVTLDNRDFVPALAEWVEPVDVVWIGQSLHHLDTPAKAAFMREVRRVLTESRLFMIWEPTTIEGEDGGGWVKRFESRRAAWKSLTDDEWARAVSHIRDADHQETSERWRALGLESGFTGARELYVDPDNLSRVYCYRP